MPLEFSLLNSELHKFWRPRKHWTCNKLMLLRFSVRIYLCIPGSSKYRVRGGYSDPSDFLVSSRYLQSHLSRLETSSLNRISDGQGESLGLWIFLASLQWWKLRTAQSVFTCVFFGQFPFLYRSMSLSLVEKSYRCVTSGFFFGKLGRFFFATGPAALFSFSKSESSSLTAWAPARNPQAHWL